MYNYRLFHSSSPLSQPERSYNLTNGGMSFLRNRFTSSTPLHNTRSAVPATDNLVSGRSGANADNLSPSLRKAINTRTDEFSSLGEALSSMALEPMLVNPGAVGRGISGRSETAGALDLAE